ncbi:nucleotidyltransferase domain-containing protein [[Clostridium] spiroforme]|nr:nucleotidyltransferase domain-containing protein [Thomasclavelia spiroformis]
MEYSTKIYTFNEVKKAVSSLIEKDYPEIEEVVLFGSYARNEATAISDIDILISKPEQIKPMIMWSFGGMLKNTLNKPIEIFRLKSIDKKSDFFQNIKKDGKILYENK